MRRITKTEPFSFRLSFKEKNRLEKLSEDDEVHMSDIVRKTLSTYMDFRESQNSTKQIT